MNTVILHVPSRNADPWPSPPEEPGEPPDLGEGDFLDGERLGAASGDSSTDCLRLQKWLDLSG